MFRVYKTLVRQALSYMPYVILVRPGEHFESVFQDSDPGQGKKAFLLQNGATLRYALRMALLTITYYPQCCATE